MGAGETELETIAREAPSFTLKHGGVCPLSNTSNTAAREVSIDQRLGCPPTWVSDEHSTDN